MADSKEEKAPAATTPDGVNGQDNEPEKITRVALKPEIVTSTPNHNGESSEDEQHEDVEVGDVDDSEILEDLPDDTEEIELVHSKLFSIAKLGLQRFTHLKKLCLRQNYISSLDEDALATLKELEELDLYDNRLKNVGETLNNLTKLTTLEMVHR